MGKTIVSKHLDTMNAQWVWEEFATHMTTSSKGKAEKRRLHTYVTTTVFDRIPSTTPGAEPPRDARDSGSARSHSTHLETSSSDRP